MRSRHRWIVVVALVLVGAFSMIGGVASAHHGRGGYGSGETTLEGVVTEFRWLNPHVLVFFDVKDDTEKVVHWSGELSSATTMIAAGMSRNSLKPGDEIVITGRPAEAGSPHSLLTSIVKADGTVVLEPGEDGGRFTDRTR